MIQGDLFVADLKNASFHRTFLFQVITFLPSLFTVLSSRFELRLRFIPRDIQEMYQTEMDAFMFLHDQVFADYITQVCSLHKQLYPKLFSKGEIYDV